jgi:cell division protein FtsB
LTRDPRVSGIRGDPPSMRTLAIVLACLLVLIQYPLWLGKGGWLRVWELDRQLAAQRAVNTRLASRNDALQAEVADLRAGKQALEERARYDLGMVKPGEIFVQINEAPATRTRSDERVRTAAVDAAESGR